MKENNNIKLVIAITVSVLIISLVIIASVYNFKPRSTIVVDGSANIEVMPDLVSINFAIESRGKTSSEAKQANDNITNQVIDSLVSIGIDKEDIQTRNLYVNEEYDWSSSTRKSLGFLASHNLVVEISTNDSEMISRVVNAGINSGSSLSYISYSLSEDLQKEINSQAITMATQNAQDKAKEMAHGLGSKLGRIIQVSESYNGGRSYPVMTMYKESLDLASGNIEPEVQNYGTSVSIIFEIK